MSLRDTYLAQLDDDSKVDAYIKAWEDLVAAEGKERALELFHEMNNGLPREQRSDVDPEGN